MHISAMPRGRPLSLAVKASLVLVTAAQFTGWVEHQANVSICVWDQPRAALLHDTIYIDGGSLWWMPGFDNGTLGPPYEDGGFQGNILAYNLSEPFYPGTNVTGILTNNSITKARGGVGNTDIGTPTFQDGALLANDAEFFLYGGLMRNSSDINNPPGPEDVLKYQAYQYGPEVPAFSKGFLDKTLDNGVNRYVTFGGGVSAPSENKAWYFSGLTSPSRGPIYFSTTDASFQPTQISNRFIELDMESQVTPKWSNKTLPSDVHGRANPEVVWVPVGKEGILVVLGGVVYPEWAGKVTHKSDNAEQNEKQSPEFMKTIDIYDIAGDKWYKQQTQSGGPGASTRGCAVVAHASDWSSFNIYYYGGYNGLDVLDAFDDTVWVLSLPSFTWTNLNKGNSIHARAGHKCFLPYPDQMMAVGGYTPLSGTTLSCLDKGPVVIFNTTSGEWLDSYDPTKYGSYGVPEKVQQVIGGGASGGATATKPVPSGWDTDALGAVFATQYDMDKISKFWPYPVASSTERPILPTDGDKGSNGKSGLPSWVPPVLGVVLGLIFVTGIIVLFCLWRRRKIFKNRKSGGGTESEEAGKRILSWIKGQPSEKVRSLSTSEFTVQSTDVEEPRNVTSAQSFYQPFPRQEMPDNQVAELGDTSTPVELHDTGLSPVDIIQKYSHVLRTHSRRPSDLSKSSTSGPVAEYNSTISQPSDGIETGASGTPRVDSPALGPVFGRSSSQKSHASTHGKGKAVNEKAYTSIPENSPAPPVSPPTAEDFEGEDYWTGKSVVSPLNKSVPQDDNNLDHATQP